MHGLQEMDLFTSVCLSHERTGEKIPYQFLYSSQLYQTVFGIYGTFDLHENSNDERKVLQGITMRLVNYKGNMNIGFSKTVPNTLFEDGGDVHNIYFEVQAGTKELETYVKIYPSIEIVKGKPIRIIFKRILLPIDGIRFDTKSREVGRIGKDDSEKNVAVNEEQEYFDEEFHFRDGPHLGNLHLLNGMYGDPDTKDIKETKKEIASPRCHQSNVNMFF